MGIRGKLHQPVATPNRLHENTDSDKRQDQTETWQEVTKTTTNKDREKHEGE
jgi:hypothetical protein